MCPVRRFRKSSGKNVWVMLKRCKKNPNKHLFCLLKMITCACSPCKAAQLLNLPDPFDACSVLWGCCDSMLVTARKRDHSRLSMKCIRGNWPAFLRLIQQNSLKAVRGVLNWYTQNRLRSREVFISVCFTNYQWGKVPLVSRYSLSALWKKLSTTRANEAEIGEQRATRGTEALSCFLRE